ncbi:MAG: addiction module protein [Verrucomicrobia bacterium]|nr:addiction module protein [Verrucomicrobiota bacterium]
MFSLQSLHELPLKEKLLAMEALWQDLSAAEADLEVPFWQQDLLDEREIAVAEGSAKFIDWEQAKNDILRPSHEN